MITIIITCYNEGIELRRAVDSIRKQTYIDYEIIVVKDFSEHAETLRVCQELEMEGIRVIYSKNNIGLSGARNLGIQFASGNYIQFLDADDELDVDALAKINNAYENFPEATAVCGDYLLDNGNEINRITSTWDTIKIFQETEFFMWGKLIGALCYKREDLLNIGGYSLLYTNGCQDVDLHIRFFKSGKYYVYTPNVLYVWHRKDTGMNSSSHNAESFDMCMYEHREFVASYINHHYLLGLCKQNNDADNYRKYFAQYAPCWCRWARILPFKLMTKFGRFVK